MAKRRAILCAVMAAILLAGAVPALASGPVVWPGGGGEYQASIGDDLVLQTGWFAATKGQVRVFLNHHTESYELRDPDGLIVWEMSAAESEPYWGPLSKVSDEELYLDCPMPTLWYTGWTYTVPEVFTEAGTYELVFTGTFEQPVHDGLHACIDLAPPGLFPPIPTPSLYRGTVVAVTTIVVE